MEKYSDIPVSKLSEERDPEKEQDLLKRMKRHDSWEILQAAGYAQRVIKGRWPEAEPYIIRTPESAYYYADHVLNDRWPEAEPQILKSPKYSYWYALRVIKGRWPEAESTILESPESAAAYTQNIIKGRWPEAEEVLKKDPEAWEEYLGVLEYLGQDIDVWEEETEESHVWD